MKLSIHAAMLLALSLASALLAADDTRPTRQPQVPIIDITDLYHPHQDVGDNFDLITAFALPEVDLKAIIFDVTDQFRGGRPGHDGGFIPALQLNSIFDRNVPFASGPYRRMKSVDDKMLDAPQFQQQGIELILRTLRQSPTPVHILSFGSARHVAVAYNREPELFRKKMARLHLSGGSSTPPVPDFIDCNTMLDPIAMIRLMRSDLPIAIYPCVANNSRGKGFGRFEPSFSYDENNTYYKLPDKRFITQMDPPLRRYLEYAMSRSKRSDFLRAMEKDGPPLPEKTLAQEHYIWETAVWICATGRKLVKRADDTYRIVPAEEVKATDQVLPNELRPCTVSVRDNGMYEYRETKGTSNFSVYYRGDPSRNEAALREALPALYLSFKAKLGQAGGPAAVR